MVLSLLKKCTSRYRKNLLPCFARREERQGQQGWAEITGRYVGASDITHWESTDHLRTPASENLWHPCCKAELPEISYHSLPEHRKNCFLFMSKEGGAIKPLCAPFPNHPGATGSSGEWAGVKENTWSATSGNDTSEANVWWRTVARAEPKDRAEGGVSWSSITAWQVPQGMTPGHRGSALHPAPALLSQGCTPSQDTNTNHHQLHSWPKASQGSSRISEWAGWRRWEHLSLTEGKLPHTPSKVYFYQGSFNWHVKQHSHI